MWDLWLLTPGLFGYALCLGNIPSHSYRNLCKIQIPRTVLCPQFKKQLHVFFYGFLSSLHMLLYMGLDLLYYICSSVAPNMYSQLRVIFL